MDRFSCTAVAVTLASFLALALSGSSDSQVFQFRNRVGPNDNTGRIINCGPKESNFKLEWTPRVLRPGAQLSVDFSINLLGSFSHGPICVTVWLKGVPDPIYHDCRDQKCVDALKVVKKFIPHFLCPIPQGFSINYPKFSYTVQPTMPLPSGSFKLAANVTNQDNQLLLCVEGEVEINDD